MTSTNITNFPGKVAIGSNVFIDDTASNKLVITGSISTTGTLSGDGSGIDNIQTSNVIGLTDNVTRIGTLEVDLTDNVTRIGTLIGTLETDLSDNSSRIATVESGDTTITGTKTFQDKVIFESNLHVKGDLLVANTVNMVVSDPIIELGSNNLNTGDLGIIMTRHGASNSNVAMFYDESVDALKMGYTLNGANDTTIELDSNALALSIQGNIEVGTANFFVNTTTSNVGIGTTNPRSTLDINATDALIVPNGTTDERPPGIEGMFRYNSTTNYFEMYINSGWMSVLPASPPSGIVSVSPSSIAYANVETEDITITGSSFDSNCVVTLEGFDGTTYITSNFTLNSDSEITFRIGTLASGQAENRPYRVLLTNGLGFTTRSAQTLRFDEGPTWSSPASQSTHYFGTIGTNTITLSATDVTGGSSVRYSVVGSLPGGLTLSGNTISGTSTEADGTTNTVTIRATDTVDTFRYTDLEFTIETQAPLFEFTSHTFDHARNTYTYRGPTLAQCQSAYNVTWDTNSNYFTVVGTGVQQWTVPATGMYEIDAYGATGGTYYYDNKEYCSGKGARIKGTFSLTRGDIIQILVGQTADYLHSAGGGTFVYKPLDGLTDGLLIAAGGGGGGWYNSKQYVFENIWNANIHENGMNGYNTNGGLGGVGGYGGGSYSYGGGGAGWFSDGQNGGTNGGGKSLTNGGNGGTYSSYGGFGGGGSSDSSGRPGGGGGYSGGGAGSSGPGGGGGSYISSRAINVLKEVNYSVDFGHGKVNIKLL
jgi:hypothetical protein